MALVMPCSYFIVFLGQGPPFTRFLYYTQGGSQRQAVQMLIIKVTQNRLVLPQRLTSDLDGVNTKPEHSIHSSKTQLCCQSRRVNGFSESILKRRTPSSEIENNGENHLRALNSYLDISRYFLSPSLPPVLTFRITLADLPSNAVWAKT